LLDRAIEYNGVLDTAKELGVSIVAWGPLASGLLTGKFHRDASVLANTPVGRRMRMQRQLERTRPLLDLLFQIAEHHGATPAQVALNWLVTFSGETVLAIPGASKVHQAQEAAGAMGLQLTPEEMSKLDETSRVG
jgi:aryl-alcohol dehydrogenase-like predicted oxidoreductase